MVDVFESWQTRILKSQRWRQHINACIQPQPYRLHANTNQSKHYFKSQLIAWVGTRTWVSSSQSVHEQQIHLRSQVWFMLAQSRFVEAQRFLIAMQRCACSPIIIMVWSWPVWPLSIVVVRPSSSAPNVNFWWKGFDLAIFACIANLAQSRPSWCCPSKVIISSTLGKCCLDKMECFWLIYHTFCSRWIRKLHWIFGGGDDDVDESRTKPWRVCVI